MDANLGCHVVSRKAQVATFSIGQHASLIDRSMKHLAWMPGKLPCVGGTREKHTVNELVKGWPVYYRTGA